MNKKTDINILKIYTFGNGTKIRLDKITAIGALDKDHAGHIFVPLFVYATEKPIRIILGFAIQKVSAESKEKITKEYNGILQAWEYFVNNN